MRAISGPLFLAAFAIVLWGLFVRGNPGGLSDAEYSKFRNLSPPKLLYSCTRTPTRKAFVSKVRECSTTGRSNCEAMIDDLVKTGTKTEVEFVAGESTYDQLRNEVRARCITTFGRQETVEFKIIESEET
jgi:hypothetical protein